MVRILRGLTQLLLIFAITILAISQSHGQLYFASDNASPSNLWEIRMDASGACITRLIGSMGINAVDIGVCQIGPGGTFAFASDGENFYTMNINTGACTMVGPFFQPPGLDNMVGLECGLDGAYGVGRELYRIDFFTGRASGLGGLPLSATGDLALHNERYYYNGGFAIFELNFDDPPNSQQIMVGPLLTGLTGFFPNCKQLLGGDAAGQMYIFDLLNQTWTQTDCVIENGISGLASADNYAPSIACDTFDIDLDFDDSSGADDFDYFGDIVNCEDTVIAVVDGDATIAATEAIDSVVVYLEGVLPDAPEEYLALDNPPANIDVQGSGTDRIVLRDAGGAGEFDFEVALRDIRYHNNASPPTPGTRDLRVQYWSFPNGYRSNLAYSEFEVISSIVDVDIGGDQRVCEGEEVTFNAGNAGFEYDWSTGSEMREIFVDDPGKYIVTVTDPNTMCYDRDSAWLFNDTFVDIKFFGEDTICMGEDAFFSIETGYEGTFDITIESLFGGQFLQYFDVGDGDILDFFPFESAPFEAVEVVALDGPSCFNLDSATFRVEVIPEEFVVVNDTICDGDSIFLNGDWRFETGDYIEILTNDVGCDSTHFALLQVLPVSETFLDMGACNPADTGLFIEVLTKTNGCDSTIYTQVDLLRTDTIRFVDQTCDPDEAGIDTLFFTNEDGCDSLIITERPLVDEDTTFVLLATCDPDLIGFDTVEFQGTAGCDSLVITERTFIERDETLFTQSTCDPDLAGIDTVFLVNDEGCDSLVITETTINPSNTIRLNFEDCNPDNVGIDTAFLSNEFGCDSIVITEVTLLPSNITRLDDLSCDPDEAGIDTVVYQNQFGCDSVVITETEFVLADTTYLFDSSCQPADTGTMVEVFTANAGCDSFVITITEYILADTTLLFQNSCNPSDTGITVELETDSDGCDSFVITTTFLWPSDEVTITGTTCNPTEARDDTLTLTNQFGCDSIIIYDITLIPLDTTFLTLTTCLEDEVGEDVEIFTTTDGCDSVVVTETVLGGLAECSLDGEAFADTIDCNVSLGTIRVSMLEGALPFSYNWTNTSLGSAGSGNHAGPGLTFDIGGLEPGLYEVIIEDVTGAQALFELEILEILLPEINLTSTTNYNGFDISCFGESDGGVQVNILSGGLGPFEYIWSTNDQGTAVNDLNAGWYTVTVTDSRNCQVVDSIELIEPAPLEIFYSTNDQDCRLGFGSLFDIQAFGGAPNYTYFLNGLSFNGQDRNNLDPGEYDFAVVDGNGCRVDSSFVIEEARPPVVSLGPDITVNYADTFDIRVLTNAQQAEIDSIIWSDGECMDCEIRELVLLEDGTLGVTLIRDDGCSGMDFINITTIFNDNIYIPNAISPNFDGLNDKLRMYEGGQVRYIEQWIIYDRYGAKVFEVQDVHPDDDIGHWDGTSRGEALDNQVFVYYVIARMNDGTTRELSGEVHLIR